MYPEKVKIRVCKANVNVHGAMKDLFLFDGVLHVYLRAKQNTVN